MILANVDDYRTCARRRLPRFLFEYLDGGAFAETTLKANSRDLQQIELRQRVLQNVDQVDTATELFGRHWSMPLALAPVGIAGLYARRGEVQAARAAEAAGIPFCLSTVSACSLDEVCQGVQAPPWFQLYIMRDRQFLRDMLSRARASGVDTLMLTVDMPVPATRYRDMRSGLSGGRPLARRLRRFGQVLTRPHWAWNVGINGRPHSLGNIAPVLGDNAGIDEFWSWMSQNFDPTVTWQDLEQLRADWPGKLVIKGVLDAQDARTAASLGVDGLVVSNHGGRQLDGAPSAIRALPRIAEALGGEIPLLMDSGIRSGLDMVRALALGADAVLAGRPWVYALAAQGQTGVEQMIALLHKELSVAMALSGCKRIADADDQILANLQRC